MRAYGLVILISLCYFSCSNRGTVNVGPEELTRKSSVTASRFSIETRGDISIVKILNPWQDAGFTEFDYYLVPQGMSIPDSLKGRSVIRVPVKRIICMSTTHIAMLKAIEESETVVGVSGTALVFDTDIRKAIESGKIPDVGYENNLDKELVVSLKPDILMAYGVSPASAEYFRKLADMGVTVMYNADYLEEHPLARCEWIKVFGLLTGKSELADSIYESASRNYIGLADSLKRMTTDRPRVLLGAPWEDVWYVSPSNSFAARLVSDAGGNYLFGDLVATNSIPFSTEAVFNRATEADIWLNPGSATNLDDIQRADYRLAQLPVFKTGRICNNNGRALPGGGNDYWESGVIHPDIILRDIASVLHPGFLPHYSPVYYRILE
ncbi:MAG TPA: ABC transporter substrate-binding protein [Bacteroidales bacterium]|nr:ABC transporter substrate-binding protein [Bacteroidales bacterium]